MIKLCGLALVGAAAYFILSESGWRGARSVCGAAFVIIFGFAVSSVVSAADTLFSLTEDGGLSEYASLLLRALGIVYASEAASETCRSLGADSCATGIDFACRAELFVLVLPVFRQLFSLSISLL